MLRKREKRGGTDLRRTRADHVRLTKSRECFRSVVSRYHEILDTRRNNESCSPQARSSRALGTQQRRLQFARLLLSPSRVQRSPRAPQIRRTTFRLLELIGFVTLFKFLALLLRANCKTLTKLFLACKKINPCRSNDNALKSKGRQRWLLLIETITLYHGLARVVIALP